MPAKRGTKPLTASKRVPPAAPQPAANPSALTISGTLCNAVTNYPISCVKVEAIFLEPQDSSTQSKRKQTPLGSAISTGRGQYQIAWLDSPSVSQRICTLASCPESQFILRVSDPIERKTLFESQPSSASGGAVTLNVSIPIPLRALSKRNWADIGERLKMAGIQKLNDLVKQLAFTSSSQSLFQDWTTTLRQNAIAALETSFLDPKGTLGRIAPVPSWFELSAPNALGAYQTDLGKQMSRSGVQHAFRELRQKLTNFSGISTIDWLIDPSKFRKSPAAAVTANQNHYVGFGPRPVPIPRYSPDLGYRDYLRTQWTSTVILVEYIQPYMASVPQAEQQLRNRFHQDFRTPDTTWQVANEILIPVLIEILTAPTGTGFGFAVAAATIPARAGATARAYLDTLIALTKLSAQELTLRYRTDFTRPDTAMSSPVWENIHTLQGFFRDSFQSVADPADANPDVFAQAAPHGQPIIPDVSPFSSQFRGLPGRAPFFLEYGEWLLLQQPIPVENYFQIRKIFDIGINDELRKQLQNFVNTTGPNQGFYKLMAGAVALQDELVKGYQFQDQGEYQAALNIYDQLNYQVVELLYDPLVATVDVVAEFAKRRSKPLHTLDDLDNFLTQWLVGDVTSIYELPSLVCSLVYLGAFTLPFVSAQCALELGDYSTAIRNFGRSAYFLVGKGPFSDTESAYRHYSANEWEGCWLDFPLYHAGDLPYTVDTEDSLPGYPNFYDDDSVYWVPGGTTALDYFVESWSKKNLIPTGIHPVEMLFFRLQMGTAMLEWADTLYRTNDDSNVSRARELYKGVYFLHGDVPPINPAWIFLPHWGPFFNGYVNPAKASQLARAKLGFTQINAGLNFFGYADDMVPILRYSTLKSAADGFAAEAKSAEQDFLNFMAQLENATVDNMKNAAMLQRANLQAQIADQQAGIAQDQAKQAQIVIAQVNQQIAAVQQQIADHDSFFGQLGDFLGGIGSEVKGMLDFSNAAAPTVGAAAGVSTEDVTAFAAANAGGLGLAGFGAFFVVSYISMSSMADADNQRSTQLSNLQNQALPAAQAQLDIANRSAAIAGLNKQVAQADAELASQLLAFAQDRYLSVEFWSYMAALSKRTMRQFLELGTRMAWLAERALSYDQNNNIRMILMDYFPARQQGAGGADRLQLDLAVLEAQHLDGLREMIPIKYTVSLARDFPLQFALLRTTGQCTFQTSAMALQLAYPGTFGHRLIAVTPSLTQAAARSPVRGLLSNGGISQITAADGSQNLSVRPADALPISEFNLGTTDMQIWGLPGGTLMQFEGSGFDTVWKLEFPAAANPSGLNGVADVLLTMNLRAQFGQDAYLAQLKAVPKTTNKTVLVSALKQKLSGLADLQGAAAKAIIAFDLTALSLPAQEKGRKINNIALLLIGGKTTASIKASVLSTKPSKTIPITFANGVAYSNAPPITDAKSTVPLSALNALVGVSVDQTLSLSVDKSANPGVDFSVVQDVLLGVDYGANI